MIGQRLGSSRLNLEGDTRTRGHHAIHRLGHECDRYIHDHRDFITGGSASLVGNRNRVRPGLRGLNIRNLNFGTDELVEHLPVAFPLEVQRLRAACANSQRQGLSLTQHITLGLGRDDCGLQNQQTHLRAGHLASRVTGHHPVFAGVCLLNIVECERLFVGFTQGLVFVQPLISDRLGAGCRNVERRGFTGEHLDLAWQLNEADRLINHH